MSKPALTDEKKRLELARRKQVADILTAEINRLGWTSARLARESDAYPSAIASLLNLEKNLGSDLALRIAKALGYPEDELLEAAGLKSSPQSGGETALRRRFLVIFDALNEGDQEVLLAQAEGLRRLRRNRNADEADKGSQQKAHEKHSRPTARK